MSLELLVKAGLLKLERQVPYAGRGAAGGLTPNGQAAQLVFITGRSTGPKSSQDRVYRSDGGHVFTRFHSAPDEVPKGDLRIYSAMRSADGYHVASNGSHTDSLFRHCCCPINERLRRDNLIFEPDQLKTPRILSCLYPVGLTLRHQLLVVKKSPLFLGDEDRTDELMFEPALARGCLHLVHTYQGDPESPLSFSGDPLMLPLTDDIEKTANTIWNALPEDIRVCLAVKFIPVSGEGPRVHIINKHEQ